MRGDAPPPARRILRSKASWGAGPPATAVLGVGPVGVAFVRAGVRRSERGQPVRLRFLVDTGAVYTVLPLSVWRRLRPPPPDRRVHPRGRRRDRTSRTRGPD